MSFSIPSNLSQAYSEDFSEWGRNVIGYWFGMSNPDESQRPFKDVMDIYLNQYNWRKILVPNSTVVDIGAHSGDTTIPIGAMTGGTVLAVECNPVVYKYLEFSCNMNRHLAKFIVASEAVTTEDNVVVTFSDHGNHMSNGGLVHGEWGLGAVNNCIQVPGLKLETICNKYLSPEEISKIDLIKVDTEGHDCLILDSSREFIDRIRPKLFIEWFAHFNRDQSDHMFDVISSMGYLALYPKTFEPARPDHPSEDLFLIHKTKL
jgi:FkbM family methyltransferase